MERFLLNLKQLERLLLPFIGTSTWLIGIYQKFQIIGELVQKYPPYTSLLVYLFLLIFAGRILEGITSVIEQYMDKKRGKKYINNYHRYSRVVFEVQPFGHHDLLELEARLKFQLGAAVSSVSALAGTWSTTMSLGGYSMLPWLFLIAVACLIFLAWQTHGRLGKLRKELLKGIAEVSFRSIESSALELVRQFQK